MLLTDVACARGCWRVRGSSGRLTSETMERRDIELIGRSSSCSGERSRGYDYEFRQDTVWLMAYGIFKYSLPCQWNIVSVYQLDLSG